MNRGNIPGYYYDEDKKKYFKIQADHLAPQGAKYAKNTVKRESRQAKSRRIAHKRIIRREKQTIKRAPVLKSAILGGIGLLREQSLASSRHLSNNESAFVSQWNSQRVEIDLKYLNGDRRLDDAYYLPNSEQMIFTASRAGGETSFLNVYNRWNWNQKTVPEIDLYGQRAPTPVCAFNTPVSSISTSSHAAYRRVLACAGSDERRFPPAHHPHNAYIGVIEEHDPGYYSGIYFTVGSRNEVLNDSSIHPSTDLAAIIGLSGVYILDITANLVNSLPFPYGSDHWRNLAPHISWLDANTVLHAVKYRKQSQVMLWDTRTSAGTSSRFTIREMLTGVFNPTKFGHQRLGDEHQIVVSNNHSIDLFDTRMPTARSNGFDTPVFSFKHIHGGPELQAAGNGNLVAAVDRDNVVQVYSTLTGTKIGSLKGPALTNCQAFPYLQKLRWYDDWRMGPTLQAVHGDGIIRWAWTGEEE